MIVILDYVISLWPLLVTVFCVLTYCRLQEISEQLTRIKYAVEYLQWKMYDAIVLRPIDDPADIGRQPPIPPKTDA